MSRYNNLINIKINIMASVKIKFRPSSGDGDLGTIYYRVIHNRVVRQMATSFKIYEHEWNNSKSIVILQRDNQQRREYLRETQLNINEDIHRLRLIINLFEKNGVSYTADDVLFSFKKSENLLSVFMNSLIKTLEQIGKVRTAETYRSALTSFMRFRNNKDVIIDDITPELMLRYEAYLRDRGVSPNSSSFYMRILRAAYNRAVEKGLSVQRFPFKHVYTGVDKTIKRALPLKVIKKIKELKLDDIPNYDYARDMFLFSFYTRGMSFVDMAYLRKQDLKNGVLSYRRRKTGQRLSIRWERCMQEIVEKYCTTNSQYLLPIIGDDAKTDHRKRYINTAHNINKNLKYIGKMLHITTPLTMYVARHSWASIAKSKNIPLSVISEAMGHDSETTTRIYLASLDTMAIDKANNMIIKSL